MHFIQQKNGYITLMGTLIAGAILTALAISLFFFSLSNTQMNMTLYDAYKAKAVTNLCAEEALQLLHDNPEFTGQKTLDFKEEGSCYFILANLGGEARLIQATGQKNQVIRRVEIQVSSIYSQIQLESWQEVADFKR